MNSWAESMCKAGRKECPYCHWLMTDNFNFCPSCCERLTKKSKKEFNSLFDMWSDTSW
jgi:hypothetical protein